MVRLRDIPVVGLVLDKISDAILEITMRPLYPLFYYETIAAYLHSLIGVLRIEENRIAQKAIEARYNGKILNDNVLQWQREAEEILKSHNQLVSPSCRCVQCLPIPNPISRFRIGRNAALTLNKVTEVIYRGRVLASKEIAYLPPVDSTGLPAFHSRIYAYKKLWEMLTNDGSPQILGIYGMPGVGKTQMIQQISEEAIKKEIFDKVARVDVGSRRWDVLDLQNQMALLLNCSFDSENNVEERASVLKNSLINGGKILVILDDVWEEIPLDIFGISVSSMDCKILVASREENICFRNNCQHPVSITTLTDDEAQELFTNTVGISQTDSEQDLFLARKVCKECAGLPLLIIAVGKALRFRSHNVWEDALFQLENGTVERIAGIDPHIYACVKLSIDRLPDNAKSCLFLCSMFPKDAAIHTRKLMQLAMGTQLVAEEESGVSFIIDILRSSSLLLDYQKDHTIKLHDFVRDVARSIAARDPEYAFLLVRCGLWLPNNDNYGTRKFMHIHLEEGDICFPHNLVCPDVHTLWLQCYKHIQQFSGGFFSMFANLRILFIQEGMFSSSGGQISLNPLDKLRTLILDKCDMTCIHQTKASFFPENLETLCIWDCHLPRPMDLPNQKNLRKLEIVGKIGEVVFLPNTISRLSSLEKLHIRNGFQILDDVSAFPVPIVPEISKLTHLKSLQTFLKGSEHFRDTNIFCKLLEFNICVGKPAGHIGNLKRSIVLHGDQPDGVESLMERAEEVVLQSTTNVDMSKFWNSDREAFADLRNLYIDKSHTMMHLASISQDNIHSGQRRTSFSELTILEIKNCSSITYLFGNSVVTCLQRLQELCIENCPVMEVIIDEDTGEGMIINFQSLKSLKLVGLPKLTSFCRDKSDQFQSLFHKMVAFPSLENLHIDDLEDISDIWAKHNYDDNVSSFSKLKSLKVYDCHKLKLVIPVPMLPRLQRLEYLNIAFCSSVISEVGTFGNTESCPLAALRSMDLESMPCLTETKLNSMDFSKAVTWYPNLENLRIRDCNSLRNVFQPSCAKSLVQLKKLCVIGCDNMTEIIGAGKQEVDDAILLPRMAELKLAHLPNLTSTWHRKTFVCG